jgi:hypothetical protein
MLSNSVRHFGSTQPALPSSTISRIRLQTFGALQCRYSAYRHDGPPEASVRRGFQKQPSYAFEYLFGVDTSHTTVMELAKRWHNRRPWQILPDLNRICRDPGVIQVVSVEGVVGVGLWCIMYKDSYKAQR